MIIDRFKHSSIQTPTEAKVFLKKIELAALITEMLDTSNSALFKQSTLHPNGFVKIILGQNNAGSFLRLHIWETENKIEPDIHNHTSRFVSKILSGEIKETCFDFKETRSNKNNYALYTYPSSPKVKTVTTLLGHASLVSRRTKTVEKGEIYSISMKTPHSTRVSPHTISLVIQLPMVSTHTKIYTKKNLRLGRLQKHKKVTKAQLLERLASIS